MPETPMAGPPPRQVSLTQQNADQNAGEDAAVAMNKDIEDVKVRNIHLAEASSRMTAKNEINDGVA